ncbi:DivIVA domain-containing protein [Actinoplanes sp. NPDC051859]|uniref:DivIVA domain-containing protein n=1 Tax=Actinoplanes sp. NPDC051859 TaxID=3363909 RepID=UPI003799D976
MGQLLLFIVVALVVAAIVFGVTVMVSGGDSGLTPVEPDGRALPLPSDRPLGEDDVTRTRFDTAFRGYRMAQVDQALHRAAYDIGYKSELISVLEAEVTALREGRTADADVLQRAREAAVAPPPPPPPGSVPDDSASAVVVPAVDQGAAGKPVTSAAKSSDADAAAKPGPVNAESVQAEPAKAKSVQAKSAQGKSVKAGSVQAESVKAEPVQAEGAENEEPAERR